LALHIVPSGKSGVTTRARKLSHRSFGTAPK
jgi:hypothetical protein